MPQCEAGHSARFAHQATVPLVNARRRAPDRGEDSAKTKGVWLLPGATTQRKSPRSGTRRCDPRDLPGAAAPQNCPVTHRAPCPPQRGPFHGPPTRDTPWGGGGKPWNGQNVPFCLLGSRSRGRRGVGSASIVPPNGGKKRGGGGCAAPTASTGLW